MFFGQGSSRQSRSPSGRAINPSALAAMLTMIFWRFVTILFSALWKPCSSSAGLSSHYQPGHRCDRLFDPATPNHWLRRNDCRVRVPGRYGGDDGHHHQRGCQSDSLTRHSLTANDARPPVDTTYVGGPEVVCGHLGREGDYSDTIVVVTINGWLSVERSGISTLTSTSVPARTFIEIGFSIRSKQQGDAFRTSTSRGGCVPS